MVEHRLAKARVASSNLVSRFNKENELNDCIQLIFRIFKNFDVGVHLRMNTNFEKQFQFLIEIDKMKNILRQTLLADGSRRENDAEHSWHFAVMAMVLFEYAEQDQVDLFRVLKMALVHDLVEVYAGDTFAYDEKGNEDKAAREAEAADKLFGLLPAEQGAEIRALWIEFDAMETSDAQYAAAIDRLQPFINNYVTQGHTWKPNGVTRSNVYKRMDMVRKAAPALWAFVEKVVAEAVAKGWLVDA